MNMRQFGIVVSQIFYLNIELKIFFRIRKYVYFLFHCYILLLKINIYCTGKRYTQFTYSIYVIHKQKRYSRSIFLLFATKFDGAAIYATIIT